MEYCWVGLKIICDQPLYVLTGSPFRYYKTITCHLSLARCKTLALANLQYIFLYPSRYFVNPVYFYFTAVFFPFEDHASVTTAWDISLCNRWAHQLGSWVWTDSLIHQGWVWVSNYCRRAFRSWCILIYSGLHLNLAPGHNSLIAHSRPTFPQPCIRELHSSARCLAYERHLNPPHNRGCHETYHLRHLSRYLTLPPISCVGSDPFVLL